MKTAAPSFSSDMAKVRSIFPEDALTDGGNSVKMPFTADGLRLALLNAERWAGVMCLSASEHRKSIFTALDVGGTCL